MTPSRVLSPPPSRGRVREGGKQRHLNLFPTPLPTGRKPVDLPLKGGGEDGGRC
jgi:hypothetical protein